MLKFLQRIYLGIKDKFVYDPNVKRLYGEAHSSKSSDFVLLSKQSVVVQLHTSRDFIGRSKGEMRCYAQLHQIEKSVVILQQIVAILQNKLKQAVE